MSLNPNVGTNQLNDFSTNGDMGAMIAAKDWNNHPLGPIDTWPESLKYYLKLMLGSKYQMWLWWGPEYYNFYNDAYAPTLGVKDPNSLGKSSKIIWAEIWDVIGPMVDNVRTTGESLYYENLLLFLERFGFKEETYHTFSYSPLADGQGGIGGVFCAVSEETTKVLSRRRLGTLHDLSDSNTKANTKEEVCYISGKVIGSNLNDIPFAAIYLLDSNTKKAYLKSSIGTGDDKSFFSSEINFANDTEDQWGFAEVEKNKMLKVLDDISNFKNIPQGPWDEHPSKAITLPIQRSGQEGLTGFMVFGLSSRLIFDQEYRNFLSLVTGQIATALANVSALEEERKRAEALLEIDKAKTVFFSNVSHEFRTPLTLMLSPLQEIISKNPFEDKESKAQLEIVYRNSLRLLKLVNTLLDFSRIEAGRVQAVFQETDIAKFTSELASAFRSAIESAGLKFKVHTEQINLSVYVDHTMWERIIFNLLSNALKFTFKGEIDFFLKQKDDKVELRVRDTGTGIPKEEISKLFSRFHRIENAKGRTHEGSGIGLAMVNELVKLHGGTISVDSVFGEGSEFTINIPTGKAHLPAEQLSKNNSEKSITLNALPDIEEEIEHFNFGNITDYKKTSAKPLESPRSSSSVKHKILIADDNADMRLYISNLLKDRYDVIAVSDGEAALKAISIEPPSLVLSDIMMPNINGIELVRQLRSNLSTNTLPIILLSARAGEEATIEGIEAGADDYIVKPFSARELLSRIESNIRISETRRFAEKNLQNVFMQAQVALTILKGDSHIIELANNKALELWGKTKDEVLNKPVVEAFPELIEQGFIQILDNVFKTGERFIGNQVPIDLIRHGKKETVYVNFIYDALLDADGKRIGIMGLGFDVTDIVFAKNRAEVVAKDLESANTDVINKNKELTKINIDLDNFIYTASHDLRAPVSNIEGLLNTLEDTVADENKNNPEFKMVVDLIKESISRFKNTIVDLTEISKIQKLEQEDVDEINCQEVIDDIKITIQDKIKESGVDLKIELVDCTSIKFSRKNFHSIVYNLLSNALKYRDPSRPLKVSLSLIKEKDFSILTIKDNGLGFNDNNKTKLFTMFKRFHDHVEGTGIGLYIVKRIMDNCGGKIEVESKENQGSTFRLFFPNNYKKEGI